MKKRLKIPGLEYSVVVDGSFINGLHTAYAQKCENCEKCFFYTMHYPAHIKLCRLRDFNKVILPEWEKVRVGFIKELLSQLLST